MTSTLMVVHTVAPSSSPLDFGATRRAIRLDTGADVESMTIGTLIFVSWAAALFVGLAKVRDHHPAMPPRCHPSLVVLTSFTITDTDRTYPLDACIGSRMARRVPLRAYCILLF